MLYISPSPLNFPAPPLNGLEWEVPLLLPPHPLAMGGYVRISRPRNSMYEHMNRRSIEHTTESHPDSQGGKRRFQGDWPGRGTLYGCHQTSELPAHVSHKVPWWDSWVLGGIGDGDHHPWGQAFTTDYGHDRGGPPRGIIGPPEGIWCTGLGQMPRDSRSLQGSTQDAPTTLDILVPADHGGQGRRIL